MEKITVYTTSEFMGNVIKYEGVLVAHGRRQYAQYPDAPYVDFIPRGKRKAVRIQKTYKPYLLVLVGWNYPEPEPICPPEGGGSKYESFNEGWKNDFNEVLIRYSEYKPLAILVDYREEKIKC